MSSVPQILTAVLNSLWQAAILALLVWLALKLLPRIDAATRYAIWWTTLAAILVLPFVHPIHLRHVAPPPTTLRQAAPRLPIRIPPPFHPIETGAAITVTARRAPAWPIAILTLWSFLLAHGIAAVARSYFHLRGVKRRAALSPHPLPGASRPARLLLSREITTPIAVGFLAPAVILPESLPSQLTASEFDCLLLHETAHLARRDDWANLIERLLRAALLLHPPARWVLRQIEREREIACDDWVVSQTGAARIYAESLARALELRLAATGALLASGIFDHRSRLRERIEMLLQRGRAFSAQASPSRVAAGAVLLGTLVFAAAWSPRGIAFAQRLTFEVASIKEDTVDGPPTGTPRRSGTLVTMHNTRVYSMIFYAYHLRGS
jgi:beta-lactamase regulating signal transducer with metallopeptidase domain